MKRGLKFTHGCGIQRAKRIKKAPATSSTHNPHRRLQGSKGMIPENEKSDGNANRDEKTFNAPAADNRALSDHKAASNSDNES